MKRIMEQANLEARALTDNQWEKLCFNESHESVQQVGGVYAPGCWPEARFDWLERNGYATISRLKNNDYLVRYTTKAAEAVLRQGQDPGWRWGEFHAIYLEREYGIEAADDFRMKYKTRIVRLG